MFTVNVAAKSTVEDDLLSGTQISLFDSEKKGDSEKKDEKISESVIKIKGKYGKNAILKGVSFEEGATQKKRNGQIGGHKA